MNDYNKNKSNDWKFIEEIKEVLRAGVISDELELKLSRDEYIYFVNKPLSEYIDYIKSYLERDTKSYKNMKIKDALYKPMLQVIEYLQGNEFTVYVVSGTERNFVRAVVCEGAGIHPNHVIGMDFTIKTSKQGNEINSVHQFNRDEDVIIAGPTENINIKTNKVIAINEEIGMAPVLAFGNSTGDFSMMEYTLKNDKYKSKCFMVLCDDNVRENGDLKKADMIKGISEQKGYNTISMKNDWKTIYGDGVKKIR